MARHQLQVKASMQRNIANLNKKESLHSHMYYSRIRSNIIVNQIVILKLQFPSYFAILKFIIVEYVWKIQGIYNIEYLRIR